MVEGILIIDKPKGISSAKAVFKIKRNLNLKKAGHTGTLDPFATGLLLVCINGATKKANYFTVLDKTYIGTMILGISTDTQDLTGKIIRVNPLKQDKLKRLDIEKGFKQFKGNIWQTPPMFSAIKSKGKPLYKLARKGIEVEVVPRQIKIFKLDLLAMSCAKFPAISFKVHCSKGTYIRTLCQDIGEYLGCGAYLAKLRRIKIGNLSTEQSIPLNRFLQLDREKQKNLVFSCDTDEMNNIR